MSTAIHGKKLLILGGASFHVKLIKAAQRMGAFVVVTDNVPYEDSPGKQIADEYWDYDIFDYPAIIEQAKEDNVDAVISGWLDPCQRPYAIICNELGLPSYATLDQIFLMTNKSAFKKMCEQYSVDTIPSYSIEDALNGNIVYPVFVKPVDSRGSRGQSICNNDEELHEAIPIARAESSNNDVVIEKYMKGNQEFQVTYFFINGEPVLLRTSDNYCGEGEMGNVVSCAVMPSRFTNAYLETTHENVKKMFKSLGIKNGPIFMQGFEDNGKFRFFDPGLRFPGVDYELVFKEVFGIDLMETMVEIAFNGEISIAIPPNVVYLKGKKASVLYLPIRAGKIKFIEGEEAVNNCKNVISYLPRYKKGDIVPWSHDVRQRLAEVDLLADSYNELKAAISFVNETIKASDAEGKELIFSRFDSNSIII